jgi:hypothetical protein
MLKKLDVCIIQLADLKLPSPPEVFLIDHISFHDMPDALSLQFMLNVLFNTQIIGQGAFSIVSKAEYCGIQGEELLIQNTCVLPPRRLFSP